MSKQEDSEPLIRLTIVVLLIWLLFYPLIDARAEGIKIYKMPETIVVRITGQKTCTENMRYHTERIDFKEYVKGVLPNEWGHHWPEESLKAGAIAVKMYAWSKYETAGFVWDCTWDQVYNPELRYDSIDQAVEDTWDWIFITPNPGKPIRTYYNAWIGGCQERSEENCMGQWNSKEDAENGMAWEEIINKYYEKGVLVSTVEKEYKIYNKWTFHLMPK